MLQWLCRHAAVTATDRSTNHAKRSDCGRLFANYRPNWIAHRSPSASLHRSRRFCSFYSFGRFATTHASLFHHFWSMRCSRGHSLWSRRTWSVLSLSNRWHCSNCAGHAWTTISMNVFSAFANCAAPAALCGIYREDSTDRRRLRCTNLSRRECLSDSICSHRWIRCDSGGFVLLPNWWDEHRRHWDFSVFPLPSMRLMQLFDRVHDARRFPHRWMNRIRSFRSHRNRRRRRRSNDNLWSDIQWRRLERQHLWARPRRQLQVLDFAVDSEPKRLPDCDRSCRFELNAAQSYSNVLPNISEFYLQGRNWKGNLLLVNGSRSNQPKIVTCNVVAAAFEPFPSSQQVVRWHRPDFE